MRLWKVNEKGSLEEQTKVDKNEWLILEGANPEQLL